MSLLETQMTRSPSAAAPKATRDALDAEKSEQFADAFAQVSGDKRDAPQTGIAKVDELSIAELEKTESHDASLGKDDAEHALTSEAQLPAATPAHGRYDLATKPTDVGAAELQEMGSDGKMIAEADAEFSSFSDHVTTANRLERDAVVSDSGRLDVTRQTETSERAALEPPASLAVGTAPASTRLEAAQPESDRKKMDPLSPGEQMRLYVNEGRARGASLPTVASQIPAGGLMQNTQGVHQSLSSAAAADERVQMLLHSPKGPDQATDLISTQTQTAVPVRVDGVKQPLVAPSIQVAALQTGGASVADLAVENVQLRSDQPGLQTTQVNTTIGAQTSAAVQAPPPLTQQVLAQIAVNSEKVANGGIEVRLEPEELGKLRLNFISREGGMLVLVTAERQETLDLLRRNADDLKAGLSDMNFEGADLEFSESETGPAWKAEEDVATEVSKPEFVQSPSIEVTATSADDRLDIRL
ncbi:MAG: flagellar hook-length control protein FliK [Pseudomonadota bacterium]